MSVPVEEVIAENQGRLIGQMSGRELEIVFYLAGLGILIGLAVVAVGAVLRIARRRARHPRR